MSGRADEDEALETFTAACTSAGTGHVACLARRHGRQREFLMRDRAEMANAAHRQARALRPGVARASDVQELRGAPRAVLYCSARYPQTRSTEGPTAAIARSSCW
jgi:hypothetical protein